MINLKKNIVVEVNNRNSRVGNSASSYRQWESYCIENDMQCNGKSFAK